jgi:hypothetical protein
MRLISSGTFLPAVAALFLLAGAAPAAWAEVPDAAPIDQNTLAYIGSVYRKLIEAENRHDLESVKPLVWESPSTLFVAKTSTPADGNWAAFWGTDVVLRHFHELYSGTFVMSPDYSKVKTVGLTADVAETYAPLNISVSYAGQAPIPKPFLMVVTWIHVSSGWKMATDIAIPVPVPP